MYLDGDIAIDDWTVNGKDVDRDLDSGDDWNEGDINDDDDDDADLIATDVFGTNGNSVDDITISGAADGSDVIDCVPEATLDDPRNAAILSLTTSPLRSDGYVGGTTMMTTIKEGQNPRG